MQFKCCRLQDGKILDDDTPDEVDVYSQVLMNQDIAKTAHLLPRHFWPECLIFRADPSRRFRQYLQVSDHRILNERLLHENLAGGSITSDTYVFINPANTFKNVLNVK